MASVDLDTALAAPGLRVVAAASVPSPWSEAALAILRHQELPMLVVHTSRRDPAFQRWNGAPNFPAVLMDKEPVRTGWAEILALAERLAPARALLPRDAERRIRSLGLCHELLGEGGLAWCARLLAIDAGLSTAGREGFPLPVSQYLAPRYGWLPGCAAASRSRAAQVLAQLDRELARSGGPYYAGSTPSALDLCSTAVINAVVPLSEADCPMLPPLRAAFAYMGQALGAALTPALVAHRDRVVAEHFTLPIEL